MVELVDKISNLQNELASLKTARSSGDKKYTDDEFNAELIRALDLELSDAKQQWGIERKDLEGQIVELRQSLDNTIVSLKAKEEVIAVLKDQPRQTIIYKESEELPNKDTAAPSIEDVFIDPSEKGVPMESHINVKSASGGSQKDKLAKLKKLGIGS